MPLIAIFIALVLTSITIGGLAFGLVAGRSSLLWLADQPVVGSFVSWIVNAVGVMRYGDGVLGNLLCFVLLMVLIPAFFGLATWALMLADQIIGGLLKQRSTRAKT